MLTVENLTVSYGGIVAVRDASLAVADRAVTCLIGRNGSGKSSLVKAIAGLVAARGRITLDDAVLSGRSPAHRARSGISLVPEDRRVFATLSVRENLLVGAPRDKREATDRLESVLTYFPDVCDLLDHRGHEISGGQQQMVVIGRALMRNPKVLILDEPSLGLAPIVVDKVFEAVVTLADHGQCVFLIEQNAYKALAVARHAYAMSQGEIQPVDAEALAADDNLQSLYL